MAFEAGSRAGAVAIVDAFVTLLKDNLQDQLDLIALDLGEPALDAPDSTHGYAKSRVFPRDISPAILVVKTESDFIDELQNFGAPRRKRQTLEVCVQLATIDIEDVERALGIYARAVETVLLEYWRTTAATTKLQKVDISTEEQQSSLREQFRQEGLILRGTPPDDQSEQLTLRVECIQSVYAPIQFI